MPIDCLSAEYLKERVIDRPKLSYCHTVRQIYNTYCLFIPILGGGRGENVLFNEALNTFYLRLYGVTHMVKDHSDSERGNPLPSLHGLRFPISCKGSLICIVL